MLQIETSIWSAIQKSTAITHSHARLTTNFIRKFVVMLLQTIYVLKIHYFPMLSIKQHIYCTEMDHILGIQCVKVSTLPLFLYDFAIGVRTVPRVWHFLFAILLKKTTNDTILYNFLTYWTYLFHVHLRVHPLAFVSLSNINIVLHVFI
jgi:hypothetical protein